MARTQNDSFRRMARELRQRLEALRRAGLDGLTLEIIVPEVRRVYRAPVETAAHEPRALVSVTREEAAPPPKPVPVSVPVPPPPMPAPSLFNAEALEEPVVPVGERPAQLAALAAEVAVCVKCPALAASRTQTVFGVGSSTARLMFVGEAPGADEDRTGVPFVGRAGQLLTDMITKGMGLTREEVYIANVLKSRPPENRNPLPDEIAHCLPYLERQIAIVRPEFLCVLGKVAASALLDTAMPLGRLRGRWHRYRGIPTIVTYHPAFLLRNPASKKEAWEDLQVLMKAMGLTPRGRKQTQDRVGD